MLSQLITTLLSWDASTWAAIIAAIAALIPIGIDLWRSWNVKQEKKKLEAEFGRSVYLPEDIERSIKYYVEPDCSSVDPAREDEIRNLVAPTQKLFEVIDDFLVKDGVYRHMIILADSGMGKTSALINYYARNRKRRKKYKIALIPLGLEDADKRIDQLIDDNKGDVNDITLFLDAFDEDTLAIVDHKERLTDLMKVCKDFKRIILTCRTQFFLSDEEIPVEPGIIRVASRKAGEGAKYTFQRLYLMPFSNKIVTKYLRKRYPWQLLRRRKAKEIVDKVPKLNVRPMLLAHIPDLLDSKKQPKYSYELYEALINAWLKREDHWVSPEKLRQFSERLAVDLFINREKRGAERIPKSELEPLAETWEIDLDGWQITGRSLLNRNAEGNYKFAHRSIMEYLFLTCDTVDLDIDWNEVDLTDQMQSFISEGLESLDINRFNNMPRANLSGVNLSKANLSGVNLSKANLSGADLNRARYDDNTQWPGGFNFRESGAIGPQANLRGADLREADLSGADLHGADLRGANLRGANLLESDLRGADLNGADLSRARYDSSTQWHQDFDPKAAGAIEA